MAPFRDRARDLSPLSTRMTARIQCSGTAKRLDASVTNAARGLTDRPLARCVAGEALAAMLDSIDAARSVTKHTIVPKDRKTAIVRAADKGEALARRPDGRLGPSLRAMRSRTLAGTEEWSVF